MAELIGAPRLEAHRPFFGYGALGGADDREVATARVSAADAVAYLLDIERHFGNEDHVRSPGDSGVEGDPAGVAAHDLDDEDAVMALGRRVQAIDRLGGNLQRRVEAEGEIGGAEVVVDRLRHADDRQSRFGVEALRDPERVLASDGDEGVEPLSGEGLPDALDPVLTLERVRA